MGKLSILVIEDDEPTRELLKAALGEAGHFVHLAPTLAGGFAALEAARPDIVILDRGLPDGDGLRLCLALRKDARFRSVPVLILTGKGEPMEKVLGLRYGADDYLAKPFELEELLARVDALIRRVRPGHGEYSDTLECGGVQIFIPGRQVTIRGNVIPLANREYELLRILMERAGTVLTRDFLLEAVWKAEAGGVGPKTVDVTIMGLRRKLGPKGGLIEAVRSSGYKMSADRKL
jgi:DNA-binding response OmpR family regulator